MINNTDNDRIIDKNALLLSLKTDNKEIFSIEYNGYLNPENN